MSESPVAGLPGDISPFDFFCKWLEPQLGYKDDEKDLAVMQNLIIGTKEGKNRKLTINISIERDLATGIMGMARGVGYPASIAAEMIAKGEIAKKGVLSPVKDIPADQFLSKIKEQGIELTILDEVIDS
jgi:saccharopine dehydrogenase-like NADP-dependent oxidoreductase